MNLVLAMESDLKLVGNYWQTLHHCKSILGYLRSLSESSFTSGLPLPDWVLLLLILVGRLMRWSMPWVILNLLIIFILLIYPLVIIGNWVVHFHLVSISFGVLLRLALFLNLFPLLIICILIKEVPFLFLYRLSWVFFFL